MKQKIKIEAFKMVGRDNFDKGEISYNDMGLFQTIYADKLEDIIESIQKGFGFDKSQMAIIDEHSNSHIQVSQLEGPDGYTVNPSQMERWKKGEMDLYTATYSFYMTHVVECPLDANEIKIY